MLDGEEPLVQFAALFGFLGTMIMSLFLHLAFILLGRQMLDAVARVQYTVLNRILGRRARRMKQSAMKTQEKLGAITDALMRDLETALRKFPNEKSYFSMRFSKEEEAYIRNRYTIGNDPLGSGSNNTSAT